MLSWQYVTKSKCQGEINHFQLCKVVLLLVNIVICFVKGDAMATGSGELASSLGGRGGGGGEGCLPRFHPLPS